MNLKTLRDAAAALAEFGQEIQNTGRKVRNWKVKRWGCSFCGKVCDPDLGDTYIILNMDGDYVCSEECRIAHQEMDHSCGTVLNDDAMFAKWLGVSVDTVRSKPKPVEQKPEKEPEKPVFNRYRALIDK